MNLYELLGTIFLGIQSLGIFGGAIAYYFASKNRKIQYSAGRNQEFYKNKNFSRAMFLIQSNKLKCADIINDERTFFAVTATLEFFTSICYMHWTKKVKTNDDLYYSFEMKQVAKNTAIQEYFKFLLRTNLRIFLSGSNRIDENNKINGCGKKIELCEEFLPYLSLQVYTYMWFNSCSIKKSIENYNTLIKKEYDLLSAKQ